MGQKVNPISFRLQVHKNWSSRWFSSSKKDFANWLAQDVKIRKIIEDKFSSRPTINLIEIERSGGQVEVTIHTAKAGVVIGRGGAGVNELKNEIQKYEHGRRFAVQRKRPRTGRGAFSYLPEQRQAGL